MSPLSLRLKSEKYFALLLLLITLLGGLVRLYELGSYPYRFDHDEMALGYEAWSIWETGRDSHGNAFPMRFRSFNNYAPPVAFYVTTPVVGLLGLNETTTRLPIALAGIATIVLVALLARAWFSPAAGLIAALLLACNPWHISYSRIAFEVGLVPFFISLGLLGFTYGMRWPVDAHRPPLGALLWLGLSALAFALLVATYFTMPVEVPLLILACTAAVLLQRPRRFRPLITWYALLLLFLSPFLVDYLANWQIYQTRFTNNSILRLENWPTIWLDNYRKHFDLQSLFVRGYGPGQRDPLPYGFGELSWFNGLSMLLGFAALLLRHRRDKAAPLNILALSLIWLLSFPVAASMVDAPERVVEYRALNLLPLPQIMAGLGWFVLFDLLRRVGRYLSAAFILVTPLLLLIPLYNFSSSYFQPIYAWNSPAFNVGLRPVIEQVRDQTDSCDKIWLEPTNQTLIYYLFLSAYPPAKYQAADKLELTYEDVPESIWRGPYLFIPYLDNWYFDYTLGDAETSRLPESCGDQWSRLIYITRKTDIPAEWPRLATSTDPDGNIYWQAVIMPHE